MSVYIHHFRIRGGCLMKKYRDATLISFLIAFLFSSILFLLSSISVLADDAADQSALDSAPEGLNIKSYFDIYAPQANGEDNPFIYNSATTEKNDTVLRLAKGAGKYGAAWSDQANGNYLDINKKQTISAWLYFGSGYGSDKKNGEGMALVLQNDPRGAHALGAGYQGLGVLGYDKATTKWYNPIENRPTNFSSEYIASTAVQNSMALEFDSQKDDVTSESDQEPIRLKFNPGDLFNAGTYFYTLNGFDTFDTVGNLKIPDSYPANSRFGAGGMAGHIALVYPSLATSYALTPIGSANAAKNSWKGFTMADTLIHSDPKSAQLVNATNPDGSDMYWHHVTFEWIPAKDGQSAEIHYAFNDKYLDGTTNTNSSSLSGYPLVTSTIKVNPDIFGKVTDNKLYWGFTGANSAGEKVTDSNGKTTYDVYSKLAVMESIPALVNAEADASITDNTLGKVITDDSTDRTVAHGDNLTLDYHLKYDTETSRVNWNQIMADIHLPKNLTYTPDSTGSIATINYKNDKTGNSATELVPGSNLTGTELKFAISEALGNYDTAAYTSANIIINGVAQNTTDKNIDVAAEPAQFSGDHQISSTSTPSFTITYKKDWSLSFKQPDPINIVYNDKNEKAILPTVLNYDKEHKFEPSDPIRYSVTVDEKTYTAETQANSTTSTATGEIPLKDLIGTDFWNIFKENSTKNVTVTATDKDGKSATTTYVIKVLQNFVNVVASPNLDFQDINYLSTTKLLKRKNSYQVSVTSRHSAWKLNVAASELTKDGKVFQGNLVYKKANGVIYNLSKDNVPVAENDAISDDLVTDIISDKWTNDTGLLLKQDGISAPGKYGGTLTWTIENSI